jgi:NADH:ubiquinone oxidoreductase subunit 3 (subunit A)
MTRFFLLFALLSFFTVSNAVEYSVGISPPLVDLGEVEPGSTQLVKFFIVTRSDEPLLVKLDPQEGNMDFFSRDAYRKFIHNYSEQQVVGWTEFLSNPVELEAADADSRGQREINFLLDIPEDAEPGYHVLMVRPTPSTVRGDAGPVGAQIITLVLLNVVFKVAGEAERNIDMVSIEPGEFASVDNKIGIYTVVKNTGTVTSTTMLIQKMFDLDGNLVGESRSNKFKLRPYETRNVRVVFSSIPVEGDYRIQTIMDFVTNATSVDSTISLYPTFTAFAIAEPSEGFPLVYIIVIIIILALAFYYYRS